MTKKRQTKADLEEVIEEFKVIQNDHITKIEELKDVVDRLKLEVDRKDLTMDNMEINYKKNLDIKDHNHKEAIAKRDDYVKRVLDRMEGVKALLHIPIQPHDVNFMNTPGVEQLKAEWNKGDEKVDGSKSFTNRRGY